MQLFLVALHVVLCLFLILIILLQPGKGGDVGAAFGGGGGGGMFGPRGPASLLTRATTFVAVTFMVTSILLALPWEEGSGSVQDQLQETDGPAFINDLIPGDNPEEGTPAE